MMKKTLSKKIKRLLKKTVFTDLVGDYFDGVHPFDLDHTPAGYMRSFGSANPEKTFYVIWRDCLGSGFFSNFTQVLSHIRRAEELGMVPVVDFKNFRTLYNTDSAVNGSTNAWEYFFHPVSPCSLEEVYRSRRVYFCNGDYPRGYSFSSNAEYRDFIASHIRMQDNVLERIRRYRDMFSSGRVLGIHFRGKEINTTPGHSFGPEPEQIIRHTDRLLESYGLDRIFVVTEEKLYEDLMIRRYGSRVFLTDAFRSARVNSYNLNPRPLHRYLLGLEILVDAELLALSRVILCSNTGVAAHAVRSARNLEHVCCIDNGRNFRSYLAAHYAHRFRRLLPAGLGGLRNRTIEFSADDLAGRFFWADGPGPVRKGQEGAVYWMSKSPVAGCFFR